jgi:hypothetical protein
MPRAPASLADALLLKERALAKLRVLQAGELERKLLAADEVQAVWGAAFARLRDLALGMGERIASRGAHRSAADLRAIVDAEVEALLESVARGEIVSDG